MKKAVISISGKQHLVSEGLELDVDHLSDDSKKNISLEPLLVLDDDKVLIGQPNISGSTVTAIVTVAEKKSDKVTSIRYKAKKRVHKVHGHRQLMSRIKITKIS